MYICIYVYVVIYIYIYIYIHKQISAVATRCGRGSEIRNALEKNGSRSKTQCGRERPVGDRERTCGARFALYTRTGAEAGEVAHACRARPFAFCASKLLFLWKRGLTVLHAPPGTQQHEEHSFPRAPRVLLDKGRELPDQRAVVCALTH